MGTWFHPRPTRGFTHAGGHYVVVTVDFLSRFSGRNARAVFNFIYSLTAGATSKRLPKCPPKGGKPDPQRRGLRPPGPPWELRSPRRFRAQARSDAGSPLCCPPGRRAAGLCAQAWPPGKGKADLSLRVGGGVVWSNGRAGWATRLPTKEGPGCPRCPAVCPRL